MPVIKSIEINLFFTVFLSWDVSFLERNWKNRKNLFSAILVVAEDFVIFEKKKEKSRKRSSLVDVNAEFFVLTRKIQIFSSSRRTTLQK